MQPRPTERTKIILSDGVERVLRYPLSSLKQAREEFGASILTQGQKALANLDEDKLPKLIWYGLKADQPELTPERVADLIDVDQLPYVLECFMDSFTKSLPNKPKNVLSSLPMRLEAESPTTETSTGCGSGASADTTSDSQSPSSGS